MAWVNVPNLAGLPAGHGFQTKSMDRMISSLVCYVGKGSKKTAYVQGKVGKTAAGGAVVVVG